MQIQWQRARAARVDVRGAQPVAQQPRQQESLLVGAGSGGDRARVRARARQARGGLLQRALPRDGPQIAAIAHERLGDALVDVERLVGEAALVAQPAVVDLDVVARQDAQRALVAHGDRDVALRRAQRAHRARALDVPRARPEAVGPRGERADGAQLDDVAAERRHVGVPVEGRDVGVRAALQQHQLVVLGDLLRVAHAAVAEDAALAVDRDQRRELQGLDEMALGLDVARDAAAPAEGDVLQRALAALVAHGAVERVVDQQELHDRLLRGLHALGLRVHDHAVLDRRGAARLQLGDALDFDQAHAARADGLAELGLVAEHRDLDVAALGRVDEHRVLRRLHLAAVDREGDRSRLGPRHLALPACAPLRGRRRARSRTRRRLRGRCGRVRPRCALRTRRGTWRSSS